MTSVNVTEAKAKLSAVLRRVKRGETIVITERGRPIARLGPALPQDETEDERIRRLEETGVILPPRNPMSKREWIRFVMKRGPKDPHGAVLAALLVERAEGR